MGRPARALVDASALRHNLDQVRRLAPRARVMAVIKANGYGHGLSWVANALSDADAFGVSSVEEGLALRQAGVKLPVCLLEGFFTADELPLLAEHRLAPTIHDESQIQALSQATLPAKLPVWIKIDTGMHRLGFAPHDLPNVLARLRACATVGDVRLMSHLANAEAAADPSTKLQIENFLTHTKNLGLETSLANSAGIVAWPDSHGDWVRPGIMLYGVSPVANQSSEQLNLKPVMTLQTSLIAVHQRKHGDAIGYGGDWRCPRDMPVGVAAIGYGDGYPRHAAVGTPVLVNGRRVPLVGRVSMDMITLDLSSQPQARVGDTVVLWGQDLPVAEVAQSAGTIAYELLCRVTERIPRVTLTNKLFTGLLCERNI